MIVKLRRLDFEGVIKLFNDFGEVEQEESVSDLDDDNK